MASGNDDVGNRCYEDCRVRKEGRHLSGTRTVRAETEALVHLCLYLLQNTIFKFYCIQGLRLFFVFLFFLPNSTREASHFVANVKVSIEETVFGPFVVSLRVNCKNGPSEVIIVTRNPTLLALKWECGEGGGVNIPNILKNLFDSFRSSLARLLLLARHVKAS